MMLQYYTRCDILHILEREQTSSNVSECSSYARSDILNILERDRTCSNVTECRLNARRDIPDILVREGIYLEKEVPHVSPVPNEWDIYLRGKECMTYVTVGHVRDRRYVTVGHVRDRAYVPTLV